MGQPSIYHATVAPSFQIEICNLDRKISSSLATSLVTRSCRPSDGMHILNTENADTNWIRLNDSFVCLLVTLYLPFLCLTIVNTCFKCDVAGKTQALLCSSEFPFVLMSRKLIS